MTAPDTDAARLRQTIQQHALQLEQESCLMVGNAPRLATRLAADLYEIVGTPPGRDETCPQCGRLRYQHAPSEGASRNGMCEEPADALDAARPAPADDTDACSHEHVRTFRTHPPHSKCLDCGLRVERRWVAVRALTDTTEEQT